MAIELKSAKNHKYYCRTDCENCDLVFQFEEQTCYSIAAQGGMSQCFDDVTNSFRTDQFEIVIIEIDPVIILCASSF